MIKGKEADLWLGFLLGIAGIAVLFNPFEIDWSNPEVLIGNRALLLAACCWAMCILCARYMNWPQKKAVVIPKS